ncbi:MAG: hypothetical protein H6Q15_1909 [Bacteroidetes bacterium]|nr:hypothetical protein [Bacteroidota bacterium]
MNLNRIVFFSLLSFVIVSVSMSSCSQKVSKDKKVKKEYTLAELKIDDMFLQACTQKELGNSTEALVLYDQVIAMDENYAAAYFDKASLLFAQKQVQEAITSSQKAISLQPNNIWYRLQLSQIYINLSKWNEAASVYEEIIKLQPDVVEYYQELAEVYQNAKDEPNMLKVIDKMEKRWGISEEISMFKFRFFSERKQLDKAEKEILKLINSYPLETKYLAILAEMKMTNKDYAKALECYRKIEQIKPEDPYINVSLTNYYLIQKDRANTYKYLRKAFENKELDYSTKVQVLFTIYGKTVDENEDDFNKFFELLKVLSVQNPNEKAIFELLCTGYMRIGDFPKAVESVKKAISLGSKDFDVYQNLLFAQSTMNLPDSMIIDSKKAIELYPEQPLFYLFLGVNYIYKEDYINAKENLEKGVKLVVDNKPLMEDFYSNLGETYHKLNDFENSDKYFDKTLELNPLNYMVLNNYAYYLSIRKAKLEKAETMAKKVADKYPTNPIYVDTYAWVLFELGKYNEARKVMENIIDSKASWSQTLIEHYDSIIKAIK